MAQSKLGLFLSRTKKDPGRLKPGLSVTPCHRLCAQGRKKALQQTISRVYLIRRMLARSYEKKPRHGGGGAKCCSAGDLQSQYRDGTYPIVCNLFSLQIRRNVLSIGLCARKRLIGLAPEGGSS